MQEKLGTMVMQNFRGGGKESAYGLCENGEYINW